MATLFTGVATALVTPFRNGEVDLKALDDLIEMQIAAGVEALIPVGTTGEPATMTKEEKWTVVRRTVERVRHRAVVIAGTGSNCTRDAIENAKGIAASGADAQLVVTPYYNKTTQAGLIAHFNAVCDAASLPVFVYNVPGRTGLNIAPATLEIICRHPNVAGVKEADANVSEILDKVRRCKDTAFYCGNDQLTVPLMSCGFKGCVSVLSNMLPKETVEMTHAALAGDFAKAGQMQLQLLPLIDALFCETSPIPVKAAMEAMNICGGELRLPLVPMQPDNRCKLLNTMESLFAAMNIPMDARAAFRNRAEVKA